MLKTVLLLIMKIHETAFITSTYRSSYKDISKDIYAHLWNNSTTDTLILQILENISKHEPLLHCLRNRFFYERIKVFFSNNTNGIFINFGAGFSMYQFIMNETISTIEIDKTDIIEHKKEKVDFWVKKRKLPKRNVAYISMDLTSCTEQEILQSLQPIIKKQPTFIVSGTIGRSWNANVRT